MKLTNEQVNFLNQHGIPIAKVFDASGMKRPKYIAAMKAVGARIAIGVPPCTSMEQHTMKWRSGHCAVCNPNSVVYAKRYEIEGEVYVAASMKTGLIKIGMAEVATERLRNMNYNGYGGVNDWEVKFVKRIKNVGKIEYESQKAINHFRLPMVYERDGVDVDCREIFKCDVNLAIQAVQQAISIYG